MYILLKVKGLVLPTYFNKSYSRNVLLTSKSIIAKTNILFMYQNLYIMNGYLYVRYVCFCKENSKLRNIYSKLIILYVPAFLYLFRLCTYVLQNVIKGSVFSMWQVVKGDVEILVWCYFFNAYFMIVSIGKIYFRWEYPLNLRWMY